MAKTTFAILDSDAQTKKQTFGNENNKEKSSGMLRLDSHDVILYAAGTWTIYKVVKNKLGAAEVCFLRKMRKTS